MATAAVLGKRSASEISTDPGPDICTESDAIIDVANIAPLAQLNPHPRDAKIVFQEEGHLYTIEGVVEHPISVTTLIHSMFTPFDADRITEMMLRSPKWPQSKYFDMAKEAIEKAWNEAVPCDAKKLMQSDDWYKSKYLLVVKEAIKLSWEVNRDEAARAGTRMHKSIEDFINLHEKERELAWLYFAVHRKVPKPLPDTPEFFRFMRYWKKLMKEGKYRPYRTEWLVYDEDKRLAGSIDLVLENIETGELSIVDWKRSKDIKTENRWQSGIDCWSHIPDCNYQHYSLQLNTYRYLLETRYGKIVAEMYLIVLHPNNDTFTRIPIYHMPNEIVSVMKRLPIATTTH